MSVHIQSMPCQISIIICRGIAENTSKCPSEYYIKVDSDINASDKHIERWTPVDAEIEEELNEIYSAKGKVPPKHCAILNDDRCLEQALHLISARTNGEIIKSKVVDFSLSSSISYVLVSAPDKDLKDLLSKKMVIRYIAINTVSFISYINFIHCIINITGNPGAPNYDIPRNIAHMIFFVDVLVRWYADSL